MSNKNFFIKTLIIVVGILILVPGLTYGLGSITEGFRVDKEVVNTRVDAWDNCKEIDNLATAKDYFIPTKTAAEWTAFLKNHPEDVMVVNCGGSTPDPFSFELVESDKAGIVTSNVVIPTGFRSMDVSIDKGLKEDKVKCGKGDWAVSCTLSAGDTLQVQGEVPAEGTRSVHIIAGTYSSGWDITYTGDVITPKGGAITPPVSPSR